MLSYQHAYHAGNHADILKHFVLTFVLKSLNKKENPYTFFDTHSGSGLYDFEDNRSLKTGEASCGIKKLLKALDDTPCFDFPDFLDYIDIVKTYAKKNLYPGSPLIERDFMRSQDFLILSELHPQEIENLRENINDSFYKKSKDSDFPSVMIHKRDGWEMLKALTPPHTKRGAVLIDPSYEESEDYELAAKTICEVFKKWSNGIFLLWYPLLAHRETEINSMLENIKSDVRRVNKNTEIVNLKLCVFDKDRHVEKSLDMVLSDEDKKNPPRLYGSGMIVINAPWKLKENGEKVVEFLKNVISFQSQEES